MPDNVDIAKLTDEGKVDLLKLGLLYSDHVVTGNFLKDEFDSVFNELNVSPVKIQGALKRIYQLNFPITIKLLQNRNHKKKTVIICF